MPDLSIIIPCHSRTDLLTACLHSIQTHGNDAPLEVIVVDDASANHAVTQVAQGFRAVTVVRQARRAGFCAAINAGLQQTTSPIVQILNDDAEVTSGWHQTPLERFQAHPKVGSIAPLVLNWSNPQIIDSAGDCYDSGGFAYSRGKGRRLSPDWLTAGEVFSAPGSAAFYRRDALLKVGGFPEKFIAYFDDIEVGFKLREAGYTCWYEPECRVLHHGSSSHGKRPGRKLTEQLACNEERVFWRHVSQSQRWKHLARHAAVLGAKAMRRWADGTLMPFFLGRARAWSEACLSSVRGG